MKKIHGNTGKIHSQESKRKASEKLKGRIWSEETRRKRSIAMQRRKFTWGDKISKALKGKKGSFLGHHHSEESKRKMSEKRKGSGTWNWKGGITDVYTLIRHSGKYYEWRFSIFKRDNFICVKCKQAKRLNADHIKPFNKIMKELIEQQGIENLFEKAMNYKPLWDINNGQTLCVECHKHTDTFGGKACA